MRKFIQKSTKLVVSTAFLFVATIVVYTAIVKEKTLLKLDDSVKYLILGNSHPVYALNDNLIPKSKNFAKSGECFFYTYTKLKSILDENKQIDKVFLAFSEIYIFGNTDSLIWKTNSLVGHYTNWAPFVSAEDLELIVQNNPLGFAGNLPNYLSSSFSNYFSNGFNLISNKKIGGYKETSKILDKEKIERKELTKRRELNLINLKYLHKIKTLCDSNHVELVFIRCPVHANYEGRKFNNEFLSLIHTEFKDAPFLDFADFQLDGASYRDYHHLNSKGASQFSAFFSKYISDEN